MADREFTKAEHNEAVKRLIIRKAFEVLDLKRRVPELMRQRGWPHADQDLVACIALAVALRRLRAGKQAIRRPAGADCFGDKWPTIAVMTAERLVEELELCELLEPPP